MDFDPELIELDAKITRALELISAADNLKALFDDAGFTGQMSITSLAIDVQTELETLFGWPRPCDGKSKKRFKRWVCDDPDPKSDDQS